MRFIKNYLYNRKFKAENLYQAQKDTNRIALSVLGLLTAFKEAEKKREERHKQLLADLRRISSETSLGIGKVREELMKLLDDNFKYFGIALGELKGSLDNFLQSQAGMANLIKKFLKIEIDNAVVESVVEKEEPTEHDKRF